jgi:hypothetical protein
LQPLRGPEGPLFHQGFLRLESEHKVPPAYSRADECARSLTARRDDELLNVDVEIVLKMAFQNRFVRGHLFVKMY